MVNQRFYPGTRIPVRDWREISVTPNTPTLGEDGNPKPRIINFAGEVGLQIMEVGDPQPIKSAKNKGDWFTSQFTFEVFDDFGHGTEFVGGQIRTWLPLQMWNTALTPALVESITKGPLNPSGYALSYLIDDLFLDARVTGVIKQVYRESKNPQYQGREWPEIEGFKPLPEGFKPVAGSAQQEVWETAAAEAEARAQAELDEISDGDVPF